MRRIDKIIVHCSATPPGRDIGAEDIRRWHVRDNGWSDIGYHSVIRRNGFVEGGRPLELPGAHTLGYNADSIGVCLIGGLDEKGRASADFTLVQWSTLARLVHELTLRFPKARVYGHRDFARKECPCFDAAAWWRSVRQEYDV